MEPITLLVSAVLFAARAVTGASRREAAAGHAEARQACRNELAQFEFERKRSVAKLNELAVESTACIAWLISQLTTELAARDLARTPNVQKFGLFQSRTLTKCAP